MAKKKAGFFRYLKEAFTFKWNLLFFAGAAAAAILSPTPDILLPLVGAAELTYLAGLTSLPRFQAAIDAKAHSEENPQLKTALEGGTTAGASNKLGDVLNNLHADGRRRFQKLRSRCLEMNKIAAGVHGRARKADADDMRTPGLDRMLWVFLRLLYSQQALTRFLDSTDENAIRKRLDELAAKKKSSEEKNDERILRSVNDAIKTAELRLENYEKAENNADYVSVELDRIEGKIQALTEMAVSHQDPDFIISEVDSVADGMSQTEDAIRELNYITGLTDEMEDAPSILEADMAEVIEA
jgi:hypothetical protein